MLEISILIGILNNSGIIIFASTTNRKVFSTNNKCASSRPLCPCSDAHCLLGLNDIIEASERLRSLLVNVSLEEFETDWQKQWLVERVSRSRRRYPRGPMALSGAFARNPT